MIFTVAILLVLAAIPTLMTIVNVASLRVPAPAPPGTWVAILMRR